MSKLKVLWPRSAAVLEMEVLTRRETSLKAACRVCGWKNNGSVGRKNISLTAGRTVVRGSLGSRGLSARAHYACVTGGRLERGSNAA